MNDFSDVILLIGAMLAFSMLSMTTARTFQSDSNLIVNSELEYRAISLATIINSNTNAGFHEIRWNDDLFASGVYFDV